MTPDEFTNESGMLDVGNGHSIWWHDWGNKDAKTPIFHLHGGPGSGNKNKNKLSFDPKVQRVIFHDQRGCGQSTPFGETEHNTTQDLISDVEALRTRLGFEKIIIAGGSWGSCLGFAYSIAYPHLVKKMLLWGIFLGTKTEINYIQQGGLKTHYPEAWEQYIEVVPEDRRKATVNFYMENFKRGADESKDFVRRWCLLEGSVMSLDGEYKKDYMNSFENDESSRALAILEAHYFQNNCFLPDGYVMENAIKLKNIPIILLQGRQDHVCPPETAYKVSKALGENCHLHIMPGGHARELVTREVMNAYSFTFLKD